MAANDRSLTLDERKRELTVLKAKDPAAYRVARREFNKEFYGTNIPTTDQKAAVEAASRSAKRQAAGVAAGYVPESAKPQLTPEEQKKARMDYYARVQGRLNRTPASPTAATKFVDVDGNGVPDLVQAGGPPATPKAATMTPATVGMIDGEPAGQRLSEMRDAAQKAFEANPRQSPEPFSPSASERAWQAANILKAKAEEERKKRSITQTPSGEQPKPSEPDTSPEEKKTDVETPAGNRGGGGGGQSEQTKPSNPLMAEWGNQGVSPPSTSAAPYVFGALQSGRFAGTIGSLGAKSIEATQAARGAAIASAKFGKPSKFFDEYYRTGNLLEKVLDKGTKVGEAGAPRVWRSATQANRAEALRGANEAAWLGYTKSKELGRNATKLAEEAAKAERTAKLFRPATRVLSPITKGVAKVAGKGVGKTALRAGSKLLGPLIYAAEAANYQLDEQGRDEAIDRTLNDYEYDGDQESMAGYLKQMGKVTGKALLEGNPITGDTMGTIGRNVEGPMQAERELESAQGDLALAKYAQQLAERRHRQLKSTAFNLSSAKTYAEFDKFSPAEKYALFAKATEQLRRNKKPQ